MNSHNAARHRRPRRWLTLAGATTAVVAMTIASSCTFDVHLNIDGVVPEATTPPRSDGDAPRALAADAPDAPVAPVAPIVLDEDFGGTSLNSDVWNTCHWWDDGGCTIASNDELEWYLPEQVRVRDGALRLTAERREVTAPDGRRFPYASGMVSTGPPVHEGEPKLAFTYGTVEVGFRAPLGSGLWPAIWMLPASEQSKPEIDLFEAVGQRPQTASMFFHPKVDPDRNVSHTVINFPAGEDLADTHSVRLQWSPGRMDFFFDGEKVWEVTGDQVPDEPMYLVMNLAVGGVYGGPPDATAFPATFEIDYTRIWSEGPE